MGVKDKNNEYIRERVYVYVYVCVCVCAYVCVCMHVSVSVCPCYHLPALIKFATSSSSAFPVTPTISPVKPRERMIVDASSPFYV